MCAVMGRYKAALLACRRSPLARFSLSQVAPADADAIRKTPYGPDTPRPEGMAVKSFVTFLLENAVKKMRERYRARAERTYGQGNVGAVRSDLHGRFTARCDREVDQDARRAMWRRLSAARGKMNGDARAARDRA